MPGLELRASSFHLALNLNFPAPISFQERRKLLLYKLLSQFLINFVKQLAILPVRNVFLEFVFLHHIFQ